MLRGKVKNKFNDEQSFLDNLPDHFTLEDSRKLDEGDGGGGGDVKVEEELLFHNNEESYILSETKVTEGESGDIEFNIDSQLQHQGYLIEQPESDEGVELSSNRKPSTEKILPRVKKISCDFCPYKTSRRSHLNEHTRMIHLKLKTICDLCGKEFSNINQHMRVVHKVLRSGIINKKTCEECNREFFDLTKHMAKGHCLKYVHEYKCEICGTEFKSRYSMLRHNTRKHTQIVECGECGKKVANLNVHIKQVHTGQNILYVCQFCRRVFRKKSGLTRHSVHCTLRSLAEQRIQQIHAELTQKPEDDFTNDKSEINNMDVKPEADYSVLTTEIDSRGSLSTDIPGNLNQDLELCVPGIQSFMKPEMAGKQSNHSSRFSDIEDIQLNPVLLNSTQELQLNPEQNVRPNPTEDLELKQDPEDDPEPERMHLNTGVPVNTPHQPAHGELKLNSDFEDELESEETGSRTVYVRIEEGSTVYTEDSTLYSDQSTVYSTEINLEQDESQSSVIADYDPESQGYTEDEEDGNLPLMMEDRSPSSSMYSAPILLSGLETESALANLSNKENNSPMFQSQVSFDQVNYNLEPVSQNFMECTGVDDEMVEEMRRMIKKKKKGSNNRMVICRDCPGQRLVRNLEKHVEKFHTVKPKKHKEVCRYQCDLCGYKTDRMTNHTLHVKTVHLGTRTICHLCGKEYSNINQHMRVMHNITKSGIKTKTRCELCEHEYYDIKQHLRRAHQIMENTVKETKCSLCGEEFSKYSNMIRHRKRVHEGLKLVCPICLKPVSNLNKHSKIHKQMNLMPSLFVNPQQLLVPSASTINLPNTTLTLPNPTLALPTPTLALPNPTLALTNPILALANTTLALPNPTLALINSTLALPNTTLALPNPTMALPNPTLGLPTSTLALPTPALALPIPTLSLSNPTSTLALPNPTSTIALPNPTPNLTLPNPTPTLGPPIPTPTLGLPESSLSTTSSTISSLTDTIKISLSTSTFTLPSSNIPLPTPALSIPPCSLTLPTSNLSLPTFSLSLPTSSLALLTQSLTLPSHSFTLPTHSLSLTSPTLTLPTHSLTLPSHSLTLPSHSLTLPTHSLSLPTHSLTQPFHSLPPIADNLPTTTVTLPPLVFSAPNVPIIPSHSTNY